MASEAKRCLYEVLSLPRECTPSEIRSAYKKLALQRHPDKLIRSGVSEAQATAQFQELVNAYEVLSDPRERAWYDSHRSRILYSDAGAGSGSGSGGSVPDLFSFFSNSVYSGYGDSKKGFYSVYQEVFHGVYQNEVVFATRMGLQKPREAPLMGNLDTHYAQVTAFYNYWIGFVTIMDFCWVDQYDVMSGPNRKSRRVMEDENKKLRKKARREFNDTVRGLAEFVKKRDKRVIDMQVKRAEESEKKRAEEKERKKELERLKAEKAMMYEDPDWAKVEEEECLDFDESLEEEPKEEELYCVACGKKFKSEKQWKNHEQSKKHKEKVAELRKAFTDEDKATIDAGDEEDVDCDASGYLSVDTDVDELRDRFEESVAFEEEQVDDDEAQSSDDTSFVDTAEVNGSEGAGSKPELNDDETSILEAMLCGRKNRKHTATKSQPKASEECKADVNSDEMDFMNYNKTKGTRKNKVGNKRRAKIPDQEAVQNDKPEATDLAEGKNEPRTEEPTSCSLSENGSALKGDDQSENNNKVFKQFADKKTKKEQNKSKKTPKGGKQGTTTKNSGNACEKCGEEFESKNKLHKHLGDTGHAALKYR